MNKYEYICRVDDLGVTVIENTFINHYLPNASGDYVKVYLYALKCAGSGKNVAMTDSQMASSLCLTEQDVINAWKYWEEEQVISVVNSPEGKVIRFENLASIFFGGKKATPEEKAPVFPGSENMLLEIEAKLSRMLGHNERDKILSWVDEYNISPQSVVLLVEDCLKREKRSLQYWEQVARTLFDNGITTYDQAWDFFESRDNRWKQHKEIMNYLGLYHTPSEPEKSLMNKWLDEYKLDMDTIKKAAEGTLGANKPSLKYLSSIIEGMVGGEDVKKATNSKTGKNDRRITGNEHGYDYEELEKLLVADFDEFNDENFED